MAFLKTENVKISGISACVPKGIEETVSYPLLSKEEVKNFIASTGVERKRKVDKNTCTSDLCLAAAEKLISDLSWNKEDISILIFVSQTPDYLQPATSCIIQNKLGLNKECFSLDISLGCSGWVYGLCTTSRLLSGIIPNSTNNNSVKALLLAGETTTLQNSPKDKTTYPLFGDAGTATALEFQSGADPMYFYMNTDGSGYDSLIIEDGGYRNPFTASSLEMHNLGEGIIASKLHARMNAMDVFSFAIKEAPKSINCLTSILNIEKDNIDYFLFHQANLFLNEQIRKKLKLPADKVPYSFKNFGNTSSATIPLTMVTELQNSLNNKKSNNIACGFGIGLSWGSVYFTTDHINIPPLVEI